MKRIAGVLLFAGVGLAQQQSITLTAGAPPPVRLDQISVSATNRTNAAEQCYWVVASYPRGKAIPAGPVCINNLASNSVVTIGWGSTGATSYDVLRFTGASLPTTANILVGAVTGTSTTDSVGTALSSYTVVTGPGSAQATIQLDNKNYVQPRLTVDTPWNLLALGYFTVATLPPGAPTYSIAFVTDGTSGGDCTVGGGTSLALCGKSSGGWISIGGTPPAPPVVTTVDFQLTAVGNVITIGDNCIASRPCILPVGNKVYVNITPGNFTSTAGTGTAWVCGRSDGAIGVYHNVTGTCDAGCIAVGASASCPVDARPLGKWTIATGVPDANGKSQYPANYATSKKNVAGTGMQIVQGDDTDTYNVLSAATTTALTFDGSTPVTGCGAWSDGGTFLQCTYTVPSGVNWIKVRGWSAGGGGGGSSSSSGAGLGGGGGGFYEAVCNTTPGGTITVQVGKGGGGATTRFATATSGGNTAFGTCFTVLGGDGGGDGTGGFGGRLTGTTAKLGWQITTALVNPASNPCSAQGAQGSFPIRPDGGGCGAGGNTSTGTTGFNGGGGISGAGGGGGGGYNFATGGTGGVSAFGNLILPATGGNGGNGGQCTGTTCTNCTIGTVPGGGGGAAGVETAGAARTGCTGANGLIHAFFVQ